MRYPNVYGIDMPAACEFVADGNSVQEIADYIGVDWLVYQDLEDLIDCALGINPKITGFDTSVFDGVYITGGVDEKYLKRIESMRNDETKEAKRLADMDIIELHNQS